MPPSVMGARIFFLGRFIWRVLDQFLTLTTCETAKPDGQSHDLGICVTNVFFVKHKRAFRLNVG